MPTNCSSSTDFAAVQRSIDFSLAQMDRGEFFSYNGARANCNVYQSNRDGFIGNLRFSARKLGMSGDAEKQSRVWELIGRLCVL